MIKRDGSYYNNKRLNGINHLILLDGPIIKFNERGEKGTPFPP